MERYHFPKQEQAILEKLSQPFAVYQFVDQRVVTIALSEGFCELFGYDDRGQAYYDMDNDMYKCVHPDDVARIVDAAFRFAAEGGSYDVIYRTKRLADSSYMIVHAMGKHVVTETGVRLAHVWYTDEGAYKEDAEVQEASLNQVLRNALHEESIMKAAHYDFLTGLPNMTHFFELANSEKDAMVSKGRHPAFLFLDLSGMKYFNAKNSFAEGNKYLQAFARLLIETFGSEYCCHIGQDHFGVVTEEDGLEDVLEGLFHQNSLLNNGDYLPVRVGIYTLSQGDVPASAACDRAKLACDALRGTYTSQFNYYRKEMREGIIRRQSILSNLDRAIEEKWIQVYYQPLVRGVNGRVCDEEALSRWHDPEMGFLSPADFIPALEDAALIYKLDLYVLDQVLEKMRKQRGEGLYTVPHSVNLSRSDFDACDIVEEIRRRVDTAGISRDLISIELTESVVGSDFDFMKQQIRRLRELGFQVWLDDFGSGYSSMEVIQSIDFDLMKFDMSFMKRLDEGENGKIILTELMRMAAALGVDTVCEGVETEEQVRFLREIGCSKMQGFYFCRPISMDEIVERYRKGIQIGFENPEEAPYYEKIGRVNLYDLAVIANEEDGYFQNIFSTLPMAIMEIKDNSISYVRSNQSYRDFAEHFFRFDLPVVAVENAAVPMVAGSNFLNLVRQCCERGERTFYDEQMSDGTAVHSFIRRIGRNPVTGRTAIAVVVLSITDANEGATYATIARALAADYYNIYYVDLETGRFIEYSSPVGEEEMAMERHGEHFFETARRDTMTRIYHEDRESFLDVFTKENVLRTLDKQGVFTATYRLIETGTPMYVNMKITRMQSDRNHIIIGISVIDSQMQQEGK